MELSKAEEQKIFEVVTTVTGNYLNLFRTREDYKSTIENLNGMQYLLIAMDLKDSGIYNRIDYYVEALRKELSKID